MKNQRFIAIAGNIGAGKSSLAEFLAKNFAVTPYFEVNDQNPFLPQFYQDMKSWAFHSQMYFLSHKFRLHQDLEKLPGNVVLDRTIYEDAEIFATALYQNGAMTDEEFATYWTLYQAIYSSLRPPDLLIHLKCSIKNLQKRIRYRGRDIEKSVPVEYLKQLQKLYDNWLAKFSACEIVTIETDKLDYVTDLVDRLDVLDKIRKFL